MYLKYVENVIPLSKLIGLLFLFCLPLLSILFLKTERNDLARPVMGTIFLVPHVWNTSLYYLYPSTEALYHMYGVLPCTTSTPVQRHYTTCMEYFPVLPLPQYRGIIPHVWPCTTSTPVQRHYATCMEYFPVLPLPQYRGIIPHVWNTSLYYLYPSTEALYHMYGILPCTTSTPVQRHYTTCMEYFPVLPLPQYRGIIPHVWSTSLYYLYPSTEVCHSYLKHTQTLNPNLPYTYLPYL